MSEFETDLDCPADTGDEGRAVIEKEPGRCLDKGPDESFLDAGGGDDGVGSVPND